MTDLYISEYRDMIVNLNGATVPVGQEDGNVVDQVISSITGTPQQSAAFNERTKFISVMAADGAVHFAIGANPTATTTNKLRPQDSPEYFGVLPGHKLSVISG